jgi:Fur family ferric uptake transcriptional regulator
VEEFVDKTIERRQGEIAKKMGFEMEEHSLVIYGRCDRPECRKEKK